MGGNENEDMGFQQLRGGSSGMNTEVSLYENVGGMTMSSMPPMFKSSGEGDTTFFGTGWDPLVTLSEGGNFGGPSSMVPQSEFANSSYPNSISHLAHYPSSDGNLVEMVPKLSQSQFNTTMNLEGAQQMDISDESNELLKDRDEKKQKNSANVRGKQTTNDTSESGEAPKENYVHMRARRGQATNSHSLAERVRREKISERMKMLQDIVPGCNNITGKAVMLDEIINYVQSLQQQVEFLSMKLATVNPELSDGFEQNLSKDILHSRDGNAVVIGSGLGANTSYSYPHGILPNQQSHPMSQSGWTNQIQGFLHMGYDTNPAADNQGFNGFSNQNM